jgi:hypothetical protein
MLSDFGLYVGGNNADTMTVVMENCWSFGSAQLVFVATGAVNVVVTCRNCSAIRSRFGFYAGNGPGILRCINCLSLHAAAAPFQAIDTANSYNNAARVVTAAGNNPILLTAADEAKLTHEATSRWISMLGAVRNTSGLLTGGIDVGLTSDMFGKSYNVGSYPIGCSAGYETIELDKVLTTATPPGTFNEASRNTDPGETNVVGGTGYIIQGVNKTGSLSANNILQPQGNIPTGYVRPPYGTEVLPSESKVIVGTQFGADGTEFEGNVTLPATSDVGQGVSYGSNGTQLTGTKFEPRIIHNAKPGKVL